MHLRHNCRHLPKQFAVSRNSFSCSWPPCRAGRFGRISCRALRKFMRVQKESQHHVSPSHPATPSRSRFKKLQPDTWHQHHVRKHLARLRTAPGQEEASQLTRLFKEHAKTKDGYLGDSFRKSCPIFNPPFSVCQTKARMSSLPFCRGASFGSGSRK